MSNNDASIWVPSTSVRLHRNRVRLCVGYVASGSLSPPSLQALQQAGTRAEDSRTGQELPPSDVFPPITIELADTTRSALSSSPELAIAAKRLFPPPLRFEQVWSKKRGQQQLFVWTGVPPSAEFVCLGMVATTTSAPPPADCIRCVPKGWCVEAEMEPQLIWSDQGSGGKPGSFWTTSAHNLLCVEPSHASPKGRKVYQLFKQDFLAGKAPSVAKSLQL